MLRGYAWLQFKKTHRDVWYSIFTHYIRRYSVINRRDCLNSTSFNITQKDTKRCYVLAIHSHNTVFGGCKHTYYPTTGLACKPQRFNVFITDPCQWRLHLKQCHQRVELIYKVKWQNSCCVNMNKACLVCSFITFRKKTFHWACSAWENIHSLKLRTS